MNETSHTIRYNDRIPSVQATIGPTEKQGPI